MAQTINALRDLDLNDHLHVLELVNEILRNSDTLMTRLEATQKALQTLNLPALNLEA